MVTDSMLILPRPQCGALGGIGAMGLPQSTDQLTNPLLVGTDAQERTYNYTQGDQMILDLAAPDYDAYIYVDFFDANGNVIHLVPNETVPLALRPAKSAMRIGAGEDGTPYLNITIGPPYGQEIAAAFAASAPLYDGVRPLSEPAEPYLAWMAGQVAAARAADPDFKGEWVYFFVSTADNCQGWVKTHITSAIRDISADLVGAGPTHVRWVLTQPPRAIDTHLAPRPAMSA